MKNLKKYKNEIALIILVLILGVAVFVFFKSFFDRGINDLTTEILAALLGSILTVLITMLIIRHQGTIEHTRELASANKTEVFKKKLELFEKFIEMYVKSALDGKLSKTELQELETLVLRIALLSHRVSVPSEEDGEPRQVNLVNKLSSFVCQLQLFERVVDDEEDLNLEDHKKYQEHFGFMIGQQFKEIAEGDHEEYKKHFGKDEKISLVTIVDIINLMKLQLGVSQSEEQMVDESVVDETKREYAMTKKLLNYRGYML